MCMIENADGRCEVWRESHHKARKAHVCSECRREIGAGEKYLSVFSVFEGRGSITKICEHCEVGCRWLSDECGGWCLDGVREDMREHADEYRRLDLWRWVAGADRKWQRFDRSGLMALPRTPALSYQPSAPQGASPSNP